MNDTDAVIVVPVDDVLDKLGHGDNWTQGSWTGEGGSMCLHQGIRSCQVVKGDAFLIEQVAARQGWGTSFNDQDGTTFDDVKQRLVEHREVFPHELEETFGPQWRIIMRLVRQAAQLTVEQAQQLHATRVAAWVAARDAARALAVRDLVGQHGFTQEHYDTLTGPWRAVFPGFDTEVVAA